MFSNLQKFLIDNNYENLFFLYVKENLDNLELKMAVPGYSKDNIDVSIDNRKLVLSGKSDKAFGFKSFKEAYNLNRDCDVNKVSANVTDGVLYITKFKPQNVAGEVLKIRVD
jgi:HSP20 family molecular chaperone IbpA